jgi:hypothetical protein
MFKIDHSKVHRMFEEAMHARWQDKYEQMSDEQKKLMYITWCDSIYLYTGHKVNLVSEQEINNFLDATNE